MLLIGFPILCSLALRYGLGVPAEQQDSAELFSTLGLSEVALVERNSLLYGNLFFCRIRVQAESLAPFVGQLEGFEQSQGAPEKPISLKLEREWWNLPEGEGQYWKNKTVTLWSPLAQPDLFFAVVRLSAGDEVEVSKTPQ